jgi:hypothetical protein
MAQFCCRVNQNWQGGGLTADHPCFDFPALKPRVSQSTAAMAVVETDKLSQDGASLPRALCGDAPSRLCGQLNTRNAPLIVLASSLRFNQQRLNCGAVCA